MIQESCPNVNRTIVRIIAELVSEYYKILVPNRQESSYNGTKDYKAIEKATDRKYYKLSKHHINWDDPRSYSEKLNYSKIYCANELKTRLTDKIEVRKWVAEKIGEKYLIPLIGVYNSIYDIDFQELPNEFVIKCNHDSGSTKIVENKNALKKRDIHELYSLYDRYYLKRKFAYQLYEMQYVDISPKIIVECYLGANIRDYKFLCFGGVPYYCWVDVDRFSDHKRNIYDADWKLQPFDQAPYEKYDGCIEKPKAFEEMLELARKLSSEFDHVRVDLYYCQDRVYFGEMTFTNGGGVEIIKPHEWDLRLGDLWRLDTSRRADVLEGI